MQVHAFRLDPNKLMSQPLSPGLYFFGLNFKCKLIVNEKLHNDGYHLEF